MAPEQDGWTAWSKHVLHELERLNVHFDRIDREYNGLKIEVEAMKVRASIRWGFLGSAVTIIVAFIFFALKRYL